MTLIPSSDFGIRGHEGKPYDVNPVCAVPGCNTRSAHAHHMWSRSHLRGQPYEYVYIPDVGVVGNRVGLCVDHHEMVTGEIGGYRARIAFENGVFWWDMKTSGQWEYVTWDRAGALDPQPPGITADMAGQRPETDEICPTCGTHKKKKRAAPTERRKSKTWTLDVPADVEIGADVLDGWVDDFAILFGFDDERSRLKRYHTLALLLAWAVQHRDELLDDIREATAA